MKLTFHCERLCPLITFIPQNDPMKKVLFLKILLLILLTEIFGALLNFPLRQVPHSTLVPALIHSTLQLREPRERTEVPWALRIHGFCILGLNWLQIKNIWEKKKLLRCWRVRPMRVVSVLNMYRFFSCHYSLHNIIIIHIAFTLH